MPIFAENKSTFEQLEAGNYLGRCYQMIHIGTVVETIPGQQPKKMNKVRLGFELPHEPTEDGKGVKTLSKEYTLSMNEKAGLRKMMEGWRGKKYSDEEAKKVEITKMLGQPCLINVIQNARGYADIAAVTAPMKGQEIPKQKNATQDLNYTEFNQAAFDTLPDFVKDKMKTSDEYQKLFGSNSVGTDGNSPATGTDDDDLPF